MMPEEKIVIKTEKLQSDAAFLSGFGKSFSGKKAANAVKALNEANGRALASAQTACNEKTIAAVQNILIKNRNRAGEEGFACLSAFFKNQEKDNLLVEKYADKDSRFELLDNLSQECTQTGEVPDFYSDESIVRNAEALDELSRKARSMKALLKANPEYEESPRSVGVRERSAFLTISVPKDCFLHTSTIWSMKRRTWRHPQRKMIPTRRKTLRHL